MDLAKIIKIYEKPSSISSFYTFRKVKKFALKFLTNQYTIIPISTAINHYHLFPP